MDQIEKQKLQTTSQSNKYLQFLKKTMPFIVSVSILSFLLFYSSAISHYFHYFSFRFSQLLFSQALERKYIFLICNGIIAVLAKNLSYTDSSPSFDLHDEFLQTRHENGAEPVSEMKATVADDEAAMKSAVEEEKENGSLNIQGETESPALITVIEDEEYDAELEESGFLIPPSTAEDEVKVSTEELNRKFDEFIRKMKEEIRIEARQQLIAT